MSLYASQIKTFKRAEPKTLGAIEIIIGMFTVILSSIVYKLHYHIQREIIILIVNGAQLVITGIVLVHAGRKPSKWLVLTTIVLQLLTAAFDVVGFGLLARHIPFRGESYFYRDTEWWCLDSVWACCGEGEKGEHKEFLANGILVTLIGFLVLACVIGLVVSFFGVYVLSVSAIKEMTPIPHSTANQHYGVGVQTQNKIHAGN
ncbi:LOW QUALITY PROTEIN: uncharacterized protein si:dkey-7j14.5 [Cyprinus carpio]|uniref:LOW QUALITY PROTEIN: uncharacterized protein si:dkey-7j14.5 n=1 Tax=Cyprinus carpio TaxID=7962 RepID=A0A9Q9X9D6_CYPCA|nr:LOW QUALITY PROTEIN: uncharacterized protein si:dkey-7j14.5 [Cyprinus carpio]